MAALLIGGWGLVLIAAYGLVRTAELALAWWRWQRRVVDARNRNGHVHR